MFKEIAVFAPRVDGLRRTAAAEDAPTLLPGKLNIAGHFVELLLGNERALLSLRIERRPVHVSTGTITEEMIRKGGPACQTWLPAGEVFLAPVPGTAEGTVVVDRHVFRGREIRGLRLKFENGKLTSMTAQTGLEPLKQLFDASGPGKDLFAAFDVGVNPKIRITGDSKMMAWMASGMITVGIGNNVWAGGGNACDFDLFTHLPGSTLTVDGRTLIENGALKP